MKLFALAAFCGLALLPNFAQSQGMDMPGMDHGPGAAPPTPGSAQEALTEANDRMMTDMTIEFSGNPDRDFVMMMIAHHQGAIDMARVEVEHGTDPQIRALAESIIAAQEQEIAEMTAWLEAHPIP